MVGKTKIQVKGKIKSSPYNKKKPVNPRFSSGKGGLLTEKIVMTVKKKKEKTDKNSVNNE